MRRRIRGILMSGKQFSLDSHMDLVQGLNANPETRQLSDSDVDPRCLPDMLEEETETGDKASLNL